MCTREEATQFGREVNFSPPAVSSIYGTLSVEWPSAADRCLSWVAVEANGVMVSSCRGSSMTGNLIGMVVGCGRPDGEEGCGAAWSGGGGQPVGMVGGGGKET